MLDTKQNSDVMVLAKLSWVWWYLKQFPDHEDLVFSLMKQELSEHSILVDKFISVFIRHKTQSYIPQ